ncbi:MAG TPA: type I methionyl aminopeptidase [Vitreimonas sp.]|nr:type I methionyl aminopeptidase [Vitreimonas sp.]
MAKAGQVAAGCLDMLVAEVKEGVTTARVDDLARQYVFDHGALPACVFYRGYRHTVCTSLNHVVCHGIPGDRELRSGDIVNIDVTVIVDGWHGDTSRMYGIGEVPRKAERLMDVTYEAMMRGIAAIKPGATLGDLGFAIQSYAEAERTSVVREFCGHGLGRVFHDAPNILHYGRPGQGEELKPGMMFTVEPMLNLGAPSVKILNDGWTAVTKDKSLSAQYEHSCGVTEDGVQIFTKSPAGLDQPHALNKSAS